MTSRKRSTININPLDSISTLAKHVASHKIKAKTETDKNNPIDSVSEFKSPSGSKKVAEKASALKAGNKRVKPLTSAEQLIDEVMDAETAEEIFSNSNKASLAPPSSRKLKKQAIGGNEVMISASFGQGPNEVVRKYAQWSIAAGIVPVHVLDTLAVTGVQIKMISELCQIYGVPFKSESARAIISSLIASNVTTGVSHGLGMEAAKRIPYVGGAIALLVQPTISYATTHALGNVFIRHFENEGTLVNINLESMSHSFKESYKSAKAAFKDRRLFQNFFSLS
jgi:uncharacterized protein (DUF697 family)